MGMIPETSINLQAEHAPYPPNADENRPGLGALPTRERKANPLVSLIVPVFNEEKSISLFHKTVSAVLARENLFYEMIFVNDGSRDATLEVLRAEKIMDNSIRILSLSRNFGK